MEPVVWETRRHPSSQWPCVWWHETQLEPTVKLRLVENKDPAEHGWCVVVARDGAAKTKLVIEPLCPDDTPLEEAKALAWAAWVAHKLEG